MTEPRKSLNSIFVDMGNGGISYEILKEDSKYGPSYFLKVSLNHMGHKQETILPFPEEVGLWLRVVTEYRQQEWFNNLSSRSPYSSFGDITITLEGQQVTAPPKTVAESSEDSKLNLCFLTHFIMRVSAIQMAPVWGDKAKSLAIAASLIKRAAESGSSLVVLPELCCVGYSHMSAKDADPLSEMVQSFRAEEGKMSKPLTSMSVMYHLARKFKIHLVWGLIEKDPGTGALYNSQVYMDPTGYYVSTRKVNPWGNDFLWCTPGNSNPPILQQAGPFKNQDGSFSTKRVGLLICRDIRNKKDEDWKSFYSPGDADIVCFSSNWGDGGFPSSTWVEFAIENKVTLIVSNRYGAESHNYFGHGGSCIILPMGKVLIDGLEWDKDCIVSAEVLNSHVLFSFRRRTRTRRQRISGRDGFHSLPDQVPVARVVG